MNTKSILACTAVVVALALFISPLVVADDAMATKKKNKANQSIEQSQTNKQNSQCVSGTITLLCGNNFSAQLQAQLGNNALGQQ